MADVSCHNATNLEPCVIAEQTVVRLLTDTDVEGRVLPAGSTGTVVGVWLTGNAYEVEFYEPFHAVVTLKPKAIAAI
jgi:hypothetical protein